MKVSIISFSKLAVLALSVTMFTHCGKSPAPSESAEGESSPATDASGSTAEVVVEKRILEEIIQGVWESTNHDLLDAQVEKIQIDFRGNGELTMIIYNQGEQQQEGHYQVTGDALSIQIIGQEEDDVSTRWDGTVLTVIDREAGQEVTFEKL